MRIGRWVFAAIFVVGYSSNVLAADLGDPDQNQSCKVSEEEQRKLGCVCVGPQQSDPMHDALISDIKGRVYASTGAGFSRVTEPTGLDIGDRVLLKSQSTALLTMGIDCKREIGPNATLVIRETENHCACAALLQKHPLHALLLGGGIVGGIGVLIFPHQVSP